MGLYSWIRSMYMAIISGEDVQYGTSPSAAIGALITCHGTTAWDAGAWTAISTSTLWTADRYVVGVLFGGIPTKAMQLELELGTGAGAAEVTKNVRVPAYVGRTIVAATYAYLAWGQYVPLPYPVKIASGNRVAGRIYCLATASSCSVKLCYATGI